jgi:transposase
MKPLSLDLRERIVARYKAGGLSQAGIAEQFDVSVRSVAKYLKMDREGVSLAPKAHSGGALSRFGPSFRARLRRCVELHPDATLETLRGMLKVPVGLSTLHGMLGAMGARIKKKPSRQ